MLGDPFRCRRQPIEAGFMIHIDMLEALVISSVLYENTYRLDSPTSAEDKFCLDTNSTDLLVMRMRWPGGKTWAAWMTAFRPEDEGLSLLMLIDVWIGAQSSARRSVLRTHQEDRRTSDYIGNGSLASQEGWRWYHPLIFRVDTEPLTVERWMASLREPWKDDRSVFLAAS